MPRHYVHRQTIELRCADEALARALLERASALQRRELAAIFDRVCTRLSPDDAVHRLAIVELELGPLAAEDFEREFCRAFERALTVALREAIAGEAPEPDTAAKPGADPGAAVDPVASAVELLEVFVETGSLPWWTDVAGADPVPAALAVLLAAPESRRRELLRRVLGRAAARHGGLERLVSAVPDEALAAAHEALTAAHEGLATKPPPAVPGRRDRRRLWIAALARLVTLELAERRPARTPRAGLAAALPPEPAPTLERPALADPRTRASDAPLDPRGALGRPPSEALARLLAALRAASATLEPEPRRALARHVELLLGPRPSPVAVRAALRWLRSAAADPLAPELRRASVAALVEEALDAASPAPELPAPSLGPAPDSLALGDAGLVLLWPLIPRLLARTELVDDDAFVDELAQARALALLAYAGHGWTPVPEHMLALDKVLLGLALDVPLEPIEALEPALLAEADRMLEAVVSHATILHDMPIDTLRATFLRRPGLLAIRDGAWLLKVERRTHDLVLDRFPWGFAWLRLPWMPDALHVEW